MHLIILVCFMVASSFGCSSEQKQDKAARGTEAAARTEAPAHPEGAPSGQVAASGEATAIGVKCEHGVDKTLCTRCDPRLEAVFQAKGDWCPEHARPESQCVLCHPDLAAQGVK